MIYFVYTNFQQRADGAIGHTSTNYTSIEDARMEYHAQLASQYNPANRANNRWATVQLVEQTGHVVLTETAAFEEATAVVAE